MPLIIAIKKIAIHFFLTIYRDFLYKWFDIIKFTI